MNLLMDLSDDVNQHTHHIIIFLKIELLYWIALD